MNVRMLRATKRLATALGICAASLALPSAVSAITIKHDNRSYDGEFTMQVLYGLKCTDTVQLIIGRNGDNAELEQQPCDLQDKAVEDSASWWSTSVSLGVTNPYDPDVFDPEYDEMPSPRATLKLRVGWRSSGKAKFTYTVRVNGRRVERGTIQVKITHYPASRIWEDQEDDFFNYCLMKPERNIYSSGGRLYCTSPAATFHDMRFQANGRKWSAWQ